MLPDIRFDWKDKESFCISLASGFVPTDDRDTILQFLSSVKAESVADYGDDGISQRATVSTGVSGKKDVVVPNPVTLAPYRTFHEIDQPESKFIFRLKNEGKEIYCRLFEADGGAWKMDAIGEIKKYCFTRTSSTVQTSQVFVCLDESIKTDEFDVTLESLEPLGRLCR